ncbi:DUF7344 domain-containing protein [Haladaptatus salinisoli]|uniref:DUF7344 domain-containing protein n=1 Tax=Haladaptatus salinisoli TaxID=2884876 RepID=UPI003F631303
MGSSSDDDDPRPSLDELLKLLADTQRRQILRYLIANADQPVPLAALLEHLYTSASDNATTKTMQSTERDRLLMQLHHFQLPKLADYGLIEYNSSLQLISYIEEPRVEALLQSESIAGNGDKKDNGDD